MKIPFTLEAWLADKSQRVETRDGRPARIICTDAKAYDGACVIALIPGYGGEEAYQFFPDGHAFSSKSSDEDCTDLFIITPGPELSEFEQAVIDYKYNSHDSSLFDPGHFDKVRNEAAELLALATEELKKTFVLLHKDDYQTAFDLGKAEALKEIEQDPESSYAFKRGFEYGKEEALKDLPGWREGFPPGTISLDVSSYDFICVNNKLLELSSLKKLPGFKEDEK